MLKIRLARFGRKKKPYYKIVVANDLAPRDGKFKEVIGNYSPLLNKEDTNRYNVNKERFDYWIKAGAQPTDRVKFIVNKCSA
jgi:small subunit ribosomal protein S16